MYLQTLSTSDLEIEKADAVSCHEKAPLQSLFSFINCLELSATFTVTKVIRLENKYVPFGY